MKKLLRSLAWAVWLVWPFRRPPAVTPLWNVSELLSLEEWRRQNPQLYGSIEYVPAPMEHPPGGDCGDSIVVESVTLEPLNPAPVGQPRVPLWAARQWALEMLGIYYWEPDQPLTMGGVVVQRVMVKVIEGTRAETGEKLSEEIRVLRIEYPDGRDEQLEFQSNGKLLFHIQG